MPAHFDTILIGTSPICVLEGCALKAAGRSPLLIDRASTFGGAWGGVEAPLVGTVESGPHSLSFSPAAREFIRRTLSVDLTPMTPDPIFIMARRVFGSYRASYQARWPYAAGRVDAGVPRSVAAWSRLLSPYYHFMRNLLNPTPRFSNPVENVVGGTPALAEMLEKLARAYALDIVMNSSVESVSIDTADKRVTVRTRNDTYSSSELIMTTRTALDQIEVDSIAHLVPSVSVPLNQLLLVLEDVDVLSFSFAQFVDSPNVWLASNLTSSLSADARAKGFRVVGIVVTHEVVPGHDAAIRIFEELHQRGLIDNTVKLAAHQWVPFNGPNRQAAELAKIEERFRPFIRTLCSDSFNQCIEQNFQRWSASMSGKQRAELAV